MRVLVRSHKTSMVQWVRGHCHVPNCEESRWQNLQFSVFWYGHSGQYKQPHPHTAVCAYIQSHPNPLHPTPSQQSSSKLVGERQTVLVMLHLTCLAKKHTGAFRVSISGSRQMFLITHAPLLLLPQSDQFCCAKFWSAKTQMHIPSEITKQWENKPYNLPAMNK